MNKNIVWIIAIVIVGIGAFFAGQHTGAGAASARGQFGSGQFAGRPGTGGQGGFGRGGMGAAGQIISIDSGSMTVKMQNGNTQIVLLSETTPVMKTVTGSPSDLQVGTNVIVGGTSNSDGSITAQSVQIRPATTTRAQ